MQQHVLQVFTAEAFETGVGYHMMAHLCEDWDRLRASGLRELGEREGEWTPCCFCLGSRPGYDTGGRGEGKRHVMKGFARV